MADLGEESVEVKPPIIMKVDAPPEDNNTITSQGCSMNNSNQTDAAKIAGKPMKLILSSSKLNNNPFTMKSSTLNSSKSSSVVLRPSQLDSKIENKPENSKNIFSLNPSRLNPFGRTESNEENSIAEKNINTESSEAKNGTSSSNSETPKFVPLVVTDSSKSNTSSNMATSVASTSNFIFGQNLHERVVSESEASDSGTGEPMPSTSCTNANGTSELLFSTAAKHTVTQDANKEVKTLTESAREYEESRANKRKYEEVTVVTGEEDEKNVLQLNCKLFTFDKASGNWQERGRGTLRLNDQEIAAENVSSYTQSRLVVRTSGNFKVVLNTKIWAEMTIDRASSKSLRLTAVDASGQIKVFLIMAGSADLDLLQRSLEFRVRSEVNRQTQLKNSTREPESKKQAIENIQ